MDKEKAALLVAMMGTMWVGEKVEKKAEKKVEKMVVLSDL